MASGRVAAPPHGGVFLALAVAFVLATCAAGPARAAGPYVEPPLFADAVADGQLPPVAERLPQTPLVANMDWPEQTVGRHGGDLQTIMARPKDVRLMVVYGYARLVKFDRRLDLVPDILRDVEVEEGRVFTLHLRPGHRWSDGHSFTAEDFRYYWEDVANNRELRPTGPPAELRVDGELPTVTFPDAYTIRYAWSKPNPGFLAALAGARPLYIYAAAHYLRPYHARYNDKDALDAEAAAQGQRNWAALHNKLDHPYNNTNTELPSLQPWVNTTEGPAERYDFVRNPYYHKVDPEGRQLPYIDRVLVRIANAKIIPAQVGTGQSDLQARYLRFDNFTFLKRNEKASDFSTHLWRIAKGSHLALFPNLNVEDSVWRELVRDVRFRRALSLGIDRYEINRVIYYGLALESQNTVLPQSPLFREGYQTAWAQHDPRAANKLLDEIGLRRRDGRGTRLLPDGRPVEIVVESAGESTEETDALQLVRDSWSAIGVRLHIKPSQREMMRNRVYSGQAVMSVSSGLENGVATPEMSPADLAPTAQVHYQWPQWGQHAETIGRAGEPIDIEPARRLMALYKDWRAAADTTHRREIWHEMLAIHADQVFTIGIVAGVLQPVVVRNTLHNVPKEGIYNWDPGAHFGIYEPDSFWFGEPRRHAGD